MQGFDWTLVQSFLAVAKHGSYSAAARAEGRSQPTIGRNIDQLQQQLGNLLFQRDHSGYQLTETGHALFEHAQAMQAAAGRISLVATGRSQSIAGTVRVTASEIVATYVLPRVFAPLIHAEPELQIEMVATDTTENLLVREADIAVRMVPPVQKDLITRKIGEVGIGLFAAQSYLDRFGTPRGVEDLSTHIVLGHDKSELIINGMQALGIPAKRSDFAFRTDAQVAYLEALIAGIGMGASQSKLALERGLIPILHQFKIPSLPVWLTAHQELQSSARVRRVYDHLAAHLGPALD